MQPTQSKNNGLNSHKGSTPQSKLLEIDRKFNVPVETLFKAFTTPADIRVWWWPTGMHTDQVDLEFREGGRYFFNMKGYEGGGGGMTGQFKEIIENQLIVMTDHFADDKGQVISAKDINMPGEWPEVVFITFEFEAIDDKTSRFHLSQQGIPNELQKDCTQGWQESFDKLEKHLQDRKH